MHARCAGHRKGDGQPCGRWPRKGATVCHGCGGGAPQVKAAAERRRAEEQAQGALRRILDNPEAPPVTDALGSLSRLAGRLEYAVDEVGARASDLQSVGIVTAAGGEQLRAELRLWDLLLGHLRGSLRDLVAAGFVNRRLELAEREAEIMGQLVSVALDAVGAVGHEREAGLQAARERFLMLAGGAA